MAYEKDLYNLDKIPDFALQPAREADSEQDERAASMNIDSFDPTVYEKLFASMPPLDMEFEPHDLMRSAASEEDLPEATPEPVFADATDAAESRVAEAVADAASAEVIAGVREGAESPAVLADGEVSANQEAVPVFAPTPPTGGETTAPPVVPQPPVYAEPVPEPEPQPQPEIQPMPDPDEALPGMPKMPETERPEIIEEPEQAPEPELEMEPVAPSAPEEVPMEIPARPQRPMPVMPAPQEPSIVAPIGNEILNSDLVMIDIVRKPLMRCFIEEDILVPDVKPDLAVILSMDGKLKLSDKAVTADSDGTCNLKLTGDFMLQTLYIPDRPGTSEAIIAIDSRLPFKEEMEIKADGNSDLVITPVLESIDYSVVNERKFRVKAVVAIAIREYRPLDIQLFEGIKDEELQLLKERIKLTDVAMRKTESMDLEEELPLKESMPEIGKILRYDVNVVENHKQVSREKAVINAHVYCNIMYLSAERQGDLESDLMEEGSDTIIDSACPVLYQGKTEFTQFIKLDNDTTPGGQAPVGSKVNFHVNQASLSPKEDEEGNMTGFTLNLNVDTGIELYKDIEKEIVTDVYHHVKEMEYDTDEVMLMNLCGTGSSEVSAREIINVPDKYGSVDQVVFISGNVGETRSSIEAGKCVVEGTVALKLICIAADDDRTPFSIRQELPFRTTTDIPGIKSDMDTDCDVLLKDLWYDKLNNRQIEVNAGILVNNSVTSQEKHQLIKNVCFVEIPEQRTAAPGIVLYITRPGDNIWKIAKKYRTTIDAIRKVNNLDQNCDVKPGMKLLIVK